MGSPLAPGQVRGTPPAKAAGYVDNRLCLVNPHWLDEPALFQLLTSRLLWPIILETDPDQEFLGFCIEFEPLALRYSPP